MSLVKLDHLYDFCYCWCIFTGCDNSTSVIKYIIITTFIHMYDFFREINFTKKKVKNCCIYFIYLLFRNGSKDEIVESNQNDTAATNDEKETIGAEDIRTIRDESSNNSIITASSGRNLEENVIAVANNKYQLDDSIIGMYINFRNFRST